MKKILENVVVSLWTGSIIGVIVCILLLIWLGNVDIVLKVGSTCMVTLIVCSLILGAKILD